MLPRILLPSDVRRRRLGASNNADRAHIHRVHHASRYYMALTGWREAGRCRDEPQRCSDSRSRCDSCNIVERNIGVDYERRTASHEASGGVASMEAACGGQRERDGDHLNLECAAVNVEL